jgi:hypothetical protein
MVNVQYVWLGQKAFLLNIPEIHTTMATLWGCSAKLRMLGFEFDMFSFHFLWAYKS